MGLAAWRAAKPLNGHDSTPQVLPLCAPTPQVGAHSVRAQILGALKCCWGWLHGHCFPRGGLNRGHLWCGEGFPWEHLTTSGLRDIGCLPWAWEVLTLLLIRRTWTVLLAALASTIRPQSSSHTVERLANREAVFWGHMYELGTIFPRQQHHLAGVNWVTTIDFLIA